ncbi:ABC transporter permease, partial [Acinetobacter baumannii]
MREIVLASSVTPWVLPLAILIAWQLGSHAGVIPANVLPAPIDVLDAAIRLTLSGELAANIAV